MRKQIPNELMWLRMENPLPIVDSEYGVANNFGSYIEMHKDLKKYSEMYDLILIHELSHSNKFFTWKDLYMDMTRTKGLSYIKLWKFMLERPKTLYQLLPIYYRKDKGWVYDINLTISYSVMILVIILNLFAWRIV